MRDRILALVLLWVMGGTCVLGAQEERSFPDVRTVYQYTTQSESNFFLYISGDESFEVLRKGSKYPVSEKCTWDWDHFMVSARDWLYLGPKETLKLDTTAWSKIIVDFGKKLYMNHFEHATEEGFKTFRIKTKFSRVPTVVYHIADGMYVGWIAREHLDECVQGKGGKVEIGFIAGNFYVDAQMRYVGEEEVRVPMGEVASYKFEMKGEGLLALLYGKKAWVWISKEEPHYIVRYRNEFPRSTFDSYLDYRLMSIRRGVSLEEWEGFVAEKVEEAKQAQQ